MRALRVAVVGLGGVGSWTVEALARHGVAELTLIDFDHVAESNINRQVQATSDTLGMAKGEALARRIATIHPGCRVHVVDAFASPTNWPGLLVEPVDVVVDACDQVSAKTAIALWALRESTRLVVVGAAGGKADATRIEADDLARVTHDPLLASLRQRVRKALASGASSPSSRAIASPKKKAGLPARMGLRCVFSREPVMSPSSVAGAAEEAEATESVSCVLPSGGGTNDGKVDATVDGTLNCHGYGSSVVVTATMGLVAAQEALRA
jgi:tRNA A37 threonylcarbamoyladenosine dehydratase